MAKKYKLIRVSEFAYNNVVNKKRKMEEEMRLITGKMQYKIPITNIMDTISSNPIILADGDLFKIARKRRRK